VYSYSHTDFIARFWRMNGHNVYYPMGFDDNGLPTERLVEKRLGLRATDIGREAFIARCLEVSEEAERDYAALWRRLGLSIDWRYTYRTIDELARRTSQLSLVELYRDGLAYRRTAPSIWCSECRTSIAQAELNDLERDTRFVTLAFGLEDGTTLPVATTRPELLPACVAIFVHPDDARYAALVGGRARVPLFGQTVPVLADPRRPERAPAP
jgi:valyl-tRNA synthetase